MTKPPQPSCPCSDAAAAAVRDSGVGSRSAYCCTGTDSGMRDKTAQSVGLGKAEAAAEIAAAEIAGRGTGEGPRQLTADDINRRVARRTADLAARQAVSTAAMLADPDGEDGDDGGAAAAAAQMAMDLMRAAEASAARGSAADPTIASLQNAFQAVVQERAMEAEGNAKVSAAAAGSVTFQSLSDGRLVVRYSAPDVGAGRVASGERTDIVQDLPALLLPLVLRVVAADQSPAARQNLAPAAMAVASPRVFWAVVRHGGVGGEDGVGFAEALEKLATGAADWASIAVRDRRRPERYSEYVSH